MLEQQQRSEPRVSHSAGEPLCHRSAPKGCVCEEKEAQKEEI